MKTCKIEGCNNKYYAKGLCQKHWSKQYWQENKECRKQYKQNNKEHISKYDKQYYLNNKEYIDECQRQYHLNNPEHTKQYYQNNRGKINKKHRQYCQTPEGKASIKAYSHNRRTLTRGLTLAIIQSVYEDNIKKYGRLTCCLCFKPIEFGDDSLEHLTPLSRGGSNDFSNLGVAHRDCNSKKGTLILDEWFKKNNQKGEKQCLKS